MVSTVLIVMGSENDFEQIAPAWKVLESLGVTYEVTVASAHRSPERVVELASSAAASNHGVILAAAGGAAHLAGVIAAHTTLPVVAVPLIVGSLGGIDALLSAVQMPSGVPIASVGIGGARNAGFFAAAILAASDPALASRIAAFREENAKGVALADLRVKQRIRSA